jgi:prolipoprotein diacylglyceryltransferase
LTFPAYIEIGSTRILLHAITEVASIFIGFRYFLYLRRKKGDAIPSQNRLWILIAAIFGAVLGSRLLGGLENPEALAASSNKLLYFYENKTVLGGFLGGLWAVETVKYFIGEKESSGDLFTYPMILGLILGRIGCFSMGVFEETYGLPTTGFTGMYLGDHIKRHPVALYEILLLILLWITIWSLERKYEFCSGARFKLFMMAYISFRFLLDFIKPHYTWAVGLSSIQIVSLAGLAYYYKYIIFPSKLIIARRVTLK